MRPSAAPLRSLRVAPRASTSSSLRRFAASPTVAAAPSTSSAQPYTPPIEAGVLPAYDLCLKYIKDSAASKKALLPALEDEIAHVQEKISSGKLNGDERAESVKELGRLRKRVWLFKGGADRFDPQVRYEFEAGLADPTTDSFRFLDQERFELGGALDLHVQNINLMHVVPDVIDVGRTGLTADLALRFPAPPPKAAPVPDQFGWTKSKSDRIVKVRDDKDGDRIIVGSKLTVGETRPQPEVEIRYFGDDSKFGTLVMVDPDVPSPSIHSFTQKIHWLVPNIPLSSATRIFPSPAFEPSTEQHSAALPEALIPYLPPHPHKGSPKYHRYVFALLTHSSEVDFSSIKSTWKGKDANLRRLHKAMRKQVGKEETVSVAGLTFFRADYDAVECPKIWEEVIKAPEVKFLTPRNSSSWAPDLDAVPLNASFRRPSPLEKSASLKRRNKALLFNQQLGIVSKGPDMDERFVTTAEWEARAAAKAARNAKLATTQPDTDGELRRLFGNRVRRNGKPVFDNAAIDALVAEVEAKVASGEVEFVVEQDEPAPAAQEEAESAPEEAAPAADAAVEPEHSKP